MQRFSQPVPAVPRQTVSRSGAKVEKENQRQPKNPPQSADRPRERACRSFVPGKTSQKHPRIVIRKKNPQRCAASLLYCTTALLPLDWEWSFIPSFLLSFTTGSSHGIRSGQESGRDPAGAGKEANELNAFWSVGGDCVNCTGNLSRSIVYRGTPISPVSLSTTDLPTTGTGIDRGKSSPGGRTLPCNRCPGGEAAMKISPVISLSPAGASRPAVTQPPGNHQRSMRLPNTTRYSSNMAWISATMFR
jgi:hypothetical protein